MKTTGTALDTGVEPKLIAYSTTGSATCEDTLFAGEMVVYRDQTLTQEVDRGGASFLVPNDGAFDTKFSVRIDGDIAPESIYKINRYRSPRLLPGEERRDPGADPGYLRSTDRQHQPYGHPRTR